MVPLGSELQPIALTEHHQRSSQFQALYCSTNYRLYSLTSTVVNVHCQSWKVSNWTLLSSPQSHPHLLHILLRLNLPHSLLVPRPRHFRLHIAPDCKLRSDRFVIGHRFSGSLDYFGAHWFPSSCGTPDWLSSLQASCCYLRLRSGLFLTNRNQSVLPLHPHLPSLAAAWFTG